MVSAMTLKDTVIRAINDKPLLRKEYEALKNDMMPSLGPRTIFRDSEPIPCHECGTTLQQIIGDGDEHMISCDCDQLSCPNCHHQYIICGDCSDCSPLWDEEDTAIPDYKKLVLTQFIGHAGIFYGDVPSDICPDAYVRRFFDYEVDHGPYTEYQAIRPNVRKWWEEMHWGYDKSGTTIEDLKQGFREHPEYANPDKISFTTGVGNEHDILYYLGDMMQYHVNTNQWSPNSLDGGWPHYWYCNKCHRVSVHTSK